MSKFKVVTAILLSLTIMAGLVLVSSGDREPTAPGILTLDLNPELTASFNEGNAYQHLYEVMDKYHKSFG